MTNTSLPTLYFQAIRLLKGLISTPSFSREEDNTAACIAGFLREHQIQYHQHLNNIWAPNRHFDPARPSLVLNSHHDTVKPNAGYTLNPFSPIERSGKLYGLGSNDAGGCLVALTAAFIYFYERKDLPFNILLAATAEEEISGANGVEALLSAPAFQQALGGSPILGALVGEPTLLQMAVAERGLMVLDCTAMGRAGHAARQEGENALYKAIDDATWFRDYRFEKTSELLGPVQMQVTAIETPNKAHNVVPDRCHFIVDVRSNELYSFEEILETVNRHTQSEIRARSMRLRSTRIDSGHPIVKAGEKMGLPQYGSPTTSDKAILPFSALKIGPGDSARSHTADEFIYLEEVKNGIQTYIQLIEETARQYAATPAVGESCIWPLKTINISK